MCCTFVIFYYHHQSLASINVPDRQSRCIFDQHRASKVLLTWLFKFQLILWCSLIEKFSKNGYDDMRTVAAMNQADLDEISFPEQQRSVFLRATLDWISLARAYNVLATWAQVILKGQ